MFAQNMAGFSSLFNRLLDPSGTATGDVVASRPSKRTGETVSAERAATKERDEKSGSTTDANPRAILFPSATPEAPRGTPIRFQTGEIRIGGLAGEGAPTLPRGVPPGWIAQPQVVIAPDLLTKGLLPGRLSRNSIPLSSARDVAFALRLTRQPAAINTAAMSVYSKPDSPSPLGTPDASNSNYDSNLPRKPGGFNEAAAHTAGVPPENPEVVLQDTAQAALVPSRGDPQAGGPSSSLSQSVSLPSLGTDSAIRPGVGSRPPEVSAVINPWNVSAGSTPQNREAGRNSLTMAPSFRMPAPAEAVATPAEAEAQTEGVTAPAPILEKTTPESRLLGPSQAFTAPETHVRAKTPTSHTPITKRTD